MFIISQKRTVRGIVRSVFSRSTPDGDLVAVLVDTCGVPVEVAESAHAYRDGDIVTTWTRVIERTVKLSDTVRSKRTYLAWLGTLDAAQMEKVASLEKALTDNMPDIKGLVAWREFVIKVVDAFEAWQAELSVDETDALIGLVEGECTWIDSIPSRVWSSLDARGLVDENRRHLTPEGLEVAQRVWEAWYKSELDARKARAIAYAQTTVNRDDSADEIIESLCDAFNVEVLSAVRIVGYLHSHDNDVIRAYEAFLAFSAMDARWGAL